MKVYIVRLEEPKYRGMFARKTGRSAIVVDMSKDGYHIAHVQQLTGEAQAAGYFERDGRRIYTNVTAFEVSSKTLDRPFTLESFLHHIQCDTPIAVGALYDNFDYQILRTTEPLHKAIEEHNASYKKGFSLLKSKK